MGTLFSQPFIDFSVGNAFLPPPKLTGSGFKSRKKNAGH